MGSQVDLESRIRRAFDSTLPQAGGLLRSDTRLVVLLEDFRGPYYDQINGFPANAMGGDVQAAVAAERSEVQLFNPEGSGVDAEVSLLQITASLDTIALISANTAILATGDSGTRGFEDFRSAGSPRCTVQTGHAAASTGAARSELRAVADREMFIPVRIVLGPRNGVHISCTTQNLDLTVAFWWREFAPDLRQRA